MKRFVSVLLLICMALALAACGSSPAPTTQPAATQAPAAEAPTAATTAAEIPATATPAGETPASNSAAAGNAELEALVAELNAEEESRDPEALIKVHYDVGGENIILYKITMDAFDIFAMMAENGEQGALDGYNAFMEKMPEVQQLAQEEIEKRAPGVTVVLRVCGSTSFNRTIATVEDGVIVYDKVNKIGTPPEDDAPDVSVEDLPPEIREKLEQALAQG